MGPSAIILIQFQLEHLQSAGYYYVHNIVPKNINESTWPTLTTGVMGNFVDKRSEHISILDICQSLCRDPAGISRESNFDSLN